MRSFASRGVALGARRWAAAGSLASISQPTAQYRHFDSKGTAYDGRVEGPHGDQTGGGARDGIADTLAGGRHVQEKPRALIYINHKPAEVIPGEENLLEVLEREGIDVPKFCYHPLLSVAGNCRMCMVQVDGTQAIIVACATAVMPGMSIITDSRLVRDAREGNLELMLINHPNDCPICEQATNCDLQNITMMYGSEMTRFREDKHAVTDFYFDPHTRVVLNRCIHCTRCVRFLNEHTQDYSLGMIGRGGLSEIGTFIDELEIKTDSALGAVQLCPVGYINTTDADEFNAELQDIELKCEQ